jgi:two-component system, NtrC family, response regulator AtoC
VKLLRVLQERELERLGGTETIRVDVRFLAATHRKLEDMVEKGEFREDLFYRLNVVPVWLPPLRARREDIEPLARHFCADLAVQHGKPAIHFDEGALRVLRRERWPGNVRQLQNFVERMVVLATTDVIGEADVTADLGRSVDFVTQVPSLRPSDPGVRPQGDLESARVDAEKTALLAALAKANGNRTVAARILGVSRRTLYYKLEQLGIET